ncbi:hypothetical protein BV898_19651, partial [Hypsibius exemplaris]
VPFSGGYQNQNGGFRNNGFRPDRNLLSPSSAASAPVHFPPNHYSSNEPFQNQLSSAPLPVATATTSLAAGTGGVAAEPNTANFTAEDFIGHRMYREAAFNIIKFGRQNDFPLEVIVFPLLCCGNSALLEKYVAKQPELQMKLMKLVELLHVDNGLNRSIVREFARDYCRPQACGLHFVKLKKIATAWVHAFNIRTPWRTRGPSPRQVPRRAQIDSSSVRLLPRPRNTLKAFTAARTVAFAKRKQTRSWPRQCRDGGQRIETWGPGGPALYTVEDSLAVPQKEIRDGLIRYHRRSFSSPLAFRDTVKVRSGTLWPASTCLADMESNAAIAPSAP